MHWLHRDRAWTYPRKYEQRSEVVCVCLQCLVVVVILDRALLGCCCGTALAVEVGRGSIRLLPVGCWDGVDAVGWETKAAAGTATRLSASKLGWCLLLGLCLEQMEEMHWKLCCFPSEKSLLFTYFSLWAEALQSHIPCAKIPSSCRSHAGHIIQIINVTFF